MENKHKHLEFIQNVITRMNSNSFLIKAWTITLVSALFALAAKDANRIYVLISYIVITAFWILDGFFISKERQYKDLYAVVALNDKTAIDFNMNTSSFNQGKRTWLAGIFSQTLIPFYGIFIATTLILMFLIK